MTFSIIIGVLTFSFELKYHVMARSAEPIHVQRNISKPYNVLEFLKFLNFLAYTLDPH
jgi:hypothetical protein